MKVLISGSSGLIGLALVRALEENEHEVVRLVRTNDPMLKGCLCWDPQHVEVDPKKFEGYDALINLAGENIASGRWTPDKKRKIRDSRVLGTRMLSELIAHLDKPPKLLINASAIGYYGNRDDEVLHEGSPPGEGFLSKVCQEWEGATEAAEVRGIRVIKLRTGMVLSSKGGALQKMLIPFRLGLGGIIGSGKQYMSWIHLDDVVGIILHVMEKEIVQGPVNVVAPEAVTNYTFTKTYGKVLHRPTIFPLPAFFARLMLGEMADELLLASTRVSPDVLLNSHYAFKHPSLDEALSETIGRSTS